VKSSQNVIYFFLRRHPVFGVNGRTRVQVTARRPSIQLKCSQRVTAKLYAGHCSNIPGERLKCFELCGYIFFTKAHPAHPPHRSPILPTGDFQTRRQYSYIAFCTELNGPRTAPLIPPPNDNIRRIIIRYIWWASTF